MRDEIERAMWDGDIDRLEELAPCKCCCYDHTFAHCPARAWGGCRGQSNDGVTDDDWQKFYEQYHGMSRSKFYRQEDTDSEEVTT